LREKDPEAFPSPEWHSLSIKLQIDPDLPPGEVGPSFLNILPGEAWSAFCPIIEFKIWGDTFLHQQPNDRVDHQCRLLIVTLDNVARLLDSKRQAILRVDEGLGEPKNANQRNAKLYRDGQSQILTTCTETLLEDLDSLRPRG
jgi:hypothetical protein